MSGGGGATGPGGGFGRDTGVDCAALRFSALLSSTSAEAAAALAIGETLDVTVQTTPVRAIVARTVGGDYVGAITTRVRELLRCLQQQVRFQATVVSVTGGDVRVDVAPL